VGAGLVCRADADWNFITFYAAPEQADAVETFARIGVYREGVLTMVASGTEPIRLGVGYNRFSLEFFSGQMRGAVETDGGTHELSAPCVELPFPGHTGLVQHTTIPLAQETLPTVTRADDFEFDVFLCHSGLQKSRYVVPCVSAALGGSGWARAEYVPQLLRDKRRAFYPNKTEFEHFLRFLEQRG
jgi:hypothetical protein